MTVLGETLTHDIERHGPMRLDRFMERCVNHYYASRDPFGARGDFITAPEVSQMFGELIGVWCASTYDIMGSPKQLQLVELGPGRGTLMADLLRAAKVAPRFLDALEVHLVETSRALRERQAHALRHETHTVSWHDTLETVPQGPMILIANEFIDALPVRQLVRRGDAFHERLVGVGEGRLCFVEDHNPVSPALVPGYALGFGEGATVEISPAREEMARTIGGRLSRYSAAALIIDYGFVVPASGDTLQALSQHRFADILEAPGEADLTAHVDFSALATALRAGGAAPARAMPQGDFLIAMGLREREAALKRHADARGRLAIATAAHRLAAQGEMGHLFKVMAATHREVPTPYPFAADEQ